MAQPHVDAGSKEPNSNKLGRVAPSEPADRQIVAEVEADGGDNLGTAAEHARVRMELRHVDPRSLKPNPNNPRRIAPSEHADRQMIANIKATGITQPPVVRPDGDDLVIVAGHGRVRAAIGAGLNEILVLVRGPDDGADNLRALSENVVRVQMGPVDQWRTIEALTSANWTEEAIGDALASPVRTIKKLRLLANVHPAILDQIAKGDMPEEKLLRTIAAAGADEQASVWKKHKPKKGQDTVTWWEVARALDKRRIYAKNAKFGPDEEQAFGIVWEDDLFEQGDQDSRYTTQVEAFFAAQAAWIEANLPKNGVLLQIDEYGQGKLPPKAERVWGQPRKSDTIGRYVDTHDGSVKEITYRLPKEEPKKGKNAASGGTSETLSEPARTRPEITQKGLAIIGDFRTDALVRALAENEIDDFTLLSLLVVAFAADNVDVKASGYSSPLRRGLAHRLANEGRITQDAALVRKAARDMLAHVLNCRPGYHSSGAAARLVGDAIGADAHLPNMATDDFLSSLSKAALEKAAAQHSVLPRPRAKETRAALIEHVSGGTFVLPAARFALSEEELASELARRTERAEEDEGNVDGPDPEIGASDEDSDPEEDHQAEELA
ncbi:ParB N-terminal domain-containing protein [Methylosinus sp. LW3]|uniref:ParB N-terminal domain-containing protein n=1 Tax=Methylosinus sp. LW3 TaxID=107635 RepID=UPI0004ACB09A|nr:ParB N-terminal domain-containing protein [Methylosinus sp. LW3]